jgi:DNA-binding NarL/FixJ family response regulator
MKLASPNGSAKQAGVCAGKSHLPAVNGMDKARKNAGVCGVVVVADSVISCEGMAAILGRDPRFRVCAAVHGRKCAAAMIELHHPDLLLVELCLEGDATQWIKGIAERFSHTRILVLSRPSERLYAERAMRAGASAWFMKDGTIDELFQAIETTVSKQHHHASQVPLRQERNFAKPGRPPKSALAALSNRELHVFSLVAAGHGIGRIAGELGISRKTVETHCENIKRKLNYRDAKALRRGAEQLLGSP